ncbi:serine/threonine-protein kinase [Intestinibacter sp.]|uniref:serine/threonine-protein kinase n=1 Tax=Intestinibacter sp. TaxID=1965304 RepID=UPI003F15866A
MEINSKLNMRVVEKVQSHGANSSLYIVEDTQLKEIFMIKQIDKNKIKESSKYFDEVRKIKKIQNRNIVRVNYATYDDDYIYISMPYYKNGSLQDIMQSRNLTVREIVKYSLDILSGIYYIHKNRILHCDIKPSNILIDGNNCAVLTDFGSSIDINSGGVGRLKNVYYKHIAPEQCYSSKVDVYVDIYQFGNTLYRMCNGEEEYNRQVKKSKNLNDLKISIVNGMFPTRKKYYPHIPRQLIEITEKCLSLDPEKRYKEAIDILNDMAKVNSNLDWIYEKSNGIYRWVDGDKIVSMYKKNGIWTARCKLDCEFEKSFEKFSDGFKYVRKILKENC